MRTQFHVRTLINHGEGRFDKYQPGDLLIPALTLILDVDDEARPDRLVPSSRSFDSMCHEALDRAWAVGNRMGRDDAQQEWPRDVRSLSVGDVLIIGENAWAVAGFGFEAIAGDGVARSLGPDAVLNSRDGIYRDPAVAVEMAKRGVEVPA